MKRSHAWRASTAAAIGAWSLALTAQAGDPPPQPQAGDPPAQPQSGTPAPNPPKKPAPQERKICREDEQTTGSNFPKLICHTKSEWDKIGRDGQG